MARRCCCLLGLAALAVAASQPALAAHARWPLGFDIEAVPGISSVAAVAQTPDGFIWIGSPRGLCRWDGATLGCFDGSQALWKPLDTGAVQALATTSDGVLWIGTDKGLFRRTASVEFEHLNGAAQTRTSAPTDKILALSSHEDALWAASLQGLHHHRGGSWRHVRWPDGSGPSGVAIDGLAVDGEGNARVLASGQVWIARADDGDLFPDTQPVEADGARAPDPQLARVRWLGEFATKWPQHAPGVVTALRDRTGAVWVGTYDGLYVRRADEEPPGHLIGHLPATAYVALLEDLHQNVWANAFGSSLFRIATPRHSSILANQGRGGDAAFAVARAQDGTIYATTEQGLSVFAKGTHRRITPKMGLPSHTVRSLALDGRQHVWMTTLHDGLIKWDGATFTRYGRREGLATEEWRAIGAVGDFLFASGSDGSVIEMNVSDGKWQPVPGVGRSCGPAGPCPARVRAIYVSPAAKRIWFTTEGEGLFVRDASAGSEALAVGGLPATGINQVEEDERGVAWAATEQGLFRLEGERVTSYSGVPGMPQQPLLQIADAGLPDGRHDLWLGTRAGILRVARAALDDVAATGLRKLNVRRYGVSDGLATEEIIGAFHPGALFDPDGSMVWFASVRGLLVFDAAFSQPHPQSVGIEGVASHGRVFPSGEWRGNRLTLKPGTRDVEISYAAPAYGAGGLQYSYRLAGLDADWTWAGARRTAFYTQLRPGDYQFIVEARVEDGHGAVPRQALALSIAPYFYQTRAFTLLLVAFTLAFTVALMALRTRQVAARFHAVAQERAKIARDFHDTLGQVFSASGLELDSLERAAPADPRLIERIRHVKQTLAHGKLAARRALWNVRHAGDAGSARRPFIQALQELGGLYEHLSLVVTSEGKERTLPRAAEEEILRIAEEAVSNAVAHGRAKRMTIELVHRPASFALWLRDDGQGFDPSLRKVDASTNIETTGLGLVGMEERARMIGATLHVHSEPGVGTEIGVVLPLA